MKVKVGGKVDLKLMPEKFEPITAEATFEVEIGDDVIEDGTIDDLEMKVKARLEKQLKEYAKIAIQEQKNTRKNLQNIMNS